MNKASFFNLCLYSWVSPIVSYANKYGSIKLSGLGNIHEALKCDHEAKRIKKAWIEKKKFGKPDDDLLLKATFSCYFWFYLYYCMW